jgi:hypothetical protein
MLNASAAPKGSSRRDVSGKWSRPLRRRIRAKWERHRSRYEEHIEWGYIRHRGVGFVAFVTKVRPSPIIAAPSPSEQVRVQ